MTSILDSHLIRLKFLGTMCVGSCFIYWVHVWVFKAGYIINVGGRSGSQEVLIFSKGMLGYNTARIPALIHHNKMFFAFCEAHKNTVTSAGITDIILKKGRHVSVNTIEWDEPEVIVHIPGRSCTNPTPIVDHERNCIILVFRTTDSRTDEEGILISAVFNQTDMMIESYDDGVTWSEPVSITESILKSEPRPVMFVPGPGHGIQLHSGRLIVPGHVFVKTDGGSKHYHNCSDQSTVLLSNDGGKNWSLGGRVPCVQDKLEQYIATNDAQALELTEDKVCLNSRTLSAYQSRAISCSDDGGLTFDKPSLKEALIEPGLYMRSGILRQAHFAGCQGSIVGFPAPREASQSKYNHDTWALFSNPASLHERKYMSIRLSRNGLWTWSGSWIIHKGPSGYSDMAYFETKGIPGASTIKTFAILYEKGRRNPYETIVFKTFTLDDVLHNIAL